MATASWHGHCKEGAEHALPCAERFIAMLKISIIHTAEESALLRLEGHLAGAWIAELRESCERLKEERRSISLDLGEVSLIERAGFELLADLAGRGVTIARASAFQLAQLAEMAGAHHTTEGVR